MKFIQVLRLTIGMNNLGRSSKFIEALSVFSQYKVAKFEWYLCPKYHRKTYFTLKIFKICFMVKKNIQSGCRIEKQKSARNSKLRFRHRLYHASKRVTIYALYHWCNSRQRFAFILVLMVINASCSSDFTCKLMLFKRLIFYAKKILKKEALIKI